MSASDGSSMCRQGGTGRRWTAAGGGDIIFQVERWLKYADGFQK